MHKHENNFSRAQTRGEVDLKKKELWGVSVLGDRFSEELLLHSSSLSLNSHLGFFLVWARATPQALLGTSKSGPLKTMSNLRMGKSRGDTFQF